MCLSGAKPRVYTHIPRGARSVLDAFSYRRDRRLGEIGEIGRQRRVTPRAEEKTGKNFLLRKPTLTIRRVNEAGASRSTS